MRFYYELPILLSMIHARRTFAFSTLLVLGLTLGAAQSATGDATYPPTPGFNSGLPVIVLLPDAPLVKGHVVVTPRAPESKVVFVIRVVPPTAFNLKNLTRETKPEAVRVTPGLIMGGVKFSSIVPRVLVNIKTKAPSEIQANADVPTSIFLGGYKPGEKVTITALQNGKKVVLGIFTVGKNGILILPAVTLTSKSLVDLSLKSPSGVKLIVLRPIVKKSEFSTAKVRVIR